MIYTVLLAKGFHLHDRRRIQSIVVFNDDRHMLQKP